MDERLRSGYTPKKKDPYDVSGATSATVRGGEISRNTTTRRRRSGLRSLYLE